MDGTGIERRSGSSEGGDGDTFLRTFEFKLGVSGIGGSYKKSVSALF